MDINVIFIYLFIHEVKNGWFIYLFINITKLKNTV